MSRNKEIKFVKWWEDNILDEYRDVKYNYFLDDKWFNSLPTDLKDIILKIDDSSWEDDYYEYYLEDLEFEIKSYLSKYKNWNYNNGGVQYLFDFSKYAECYENTIDNINTISQNKHKLIDFSNCKINGNKIYEKSSMKKHGVIYNNEKYLLKFMEKNIARHYNYRKYNNKTYFNSIYSEYISCHIGKMIGLNIQDTFIGYEKIINQNNEIEYLPCVACKDFCKDDEILLSFEEIFQRTNRKAPYSYNKNKFYDILEVINKQSFIDKQQLKEWVLDMFIFDSFIGNFDRNLNNFGIILNTKNETYRIAPIFDCASSLHSKASRKRIKFLADSYKKIVSLCMNIY